MTIGPTWSPPLRCLSRWDTPIVTARSGAEALKRARADRALAKRRAPRALSPRRQHLRVGAKAAHRRACTPRTHRRCEDAERGGPAPRRAREDSMKAPAYPRIVRTAANVLRGVSVAGTQD